MLIGMQCDVLAKHSKEKVLYSGIIAGEPLMTEYDDHCVVLILVDGKLRTEFSHRLSNIQPDQPKNLRPEPFL